MKPLPSPETCAQCGEAIPPRARACPECGADERTGWREASVYDGLDLPETTEEDTAVLHPPQNNKPRGIRWYWWLTALGLLVLIGLGALAFR